MVKLECVMCIINYFVRTISPTFFILFKNFLIKENERESFFFCKKVGLVMDLLKKRNSKENYCSEKCLEKARRLTLSSFFSMHFFLKNLFENLTKWKIRNNFNI